MVTFKLVFFYVGYFKCFFINLTECIEMRDDGHVRFLLPEDELLPNALENMEGLRVIYEYATRYQFSLREAIIFILVKKFAVPIIHAMKIVTVILPLGVMIVHAMQAIFIINTWAARRVKYISC